jgi:UDP-N-acetylglucosamine 2-epimerase
MDTQKVIFWNNIDPGGDKIAKMWRMYKPLDNTKFIRHIEPENFAALLMLSECIIGNSSTGIREASFLGVQSINVGDRQHGRERGANVSSIYDAYIAGRGNSHRPSDLYGEGDAGQKIARRISDVLHGRPQ